MTVDEYNKYCAGLPHAFHSLQWGDAQVWKVGTETAFKVFAIAGWNKETDGFAVTFKVGEIAYEMLRDTPGCRPAPYLASRGMKWIQRMTDEGVTDEDLQDYLRESYRLVSLGLTKKLQKELGLNQENNNAKNNI